MIKDFTISFHHHSHQSCLSPCHLHMVRKNSYEVSLLLPCPSYNLSLHLGAKDQHGPFKLEIGPCHFCAQNHPVVPHLTQSKMPGSHWDLQGPAGSVPTPKLLVLPPATVSRTHLLQPPQAWKAWSHPLPSPFLLPESLVLTSSSSLLKVLPKRPFQTILLKIVLFLPSPDRVT